MSDKKKAVKYMTLDELFADASTTTMFEDVEARIQEKCAKRLGDEDRSRQERSWSMIASKIVGHEGP